MRKKQYWVISEGKANMPGQDFIVVPDSASVTVALEPAQSAIHSLLLLTKGEEMSGFNEWVTRTAAALTPQEARIHELVTIGVHYAIVPQRSWPSFPAYVDYLAGCDPFSLRDKLMEAYARFPPLEGREFQGMGDEPLPIDVKAVLADVGSYLGFLRERFEADLIDAGLEAEAYSYVIDPPALQELIVSHLRKMWSEYLAPEWERVEPMLQDAVEAWRQVDFAGMTRLQSAELIAGPALEGFKCCIQTIERAEHVVFVPSAHVGPYLGTFYAGGTFWILFGARLPQGAKYHAPDLSRAEVLVRLSALADNNRLRILKMISERGEQRSQDVISSLELSQSTVSRHLKQLCATGYLSERRCNGAKCYELNPERIRDTLQAISAFLLGS
jgi:DNA-binding transcriptional ArsR family regulator